MGNLKIGELIKISKGKKQIVSDDSNLRFIQIEDLRDDLNLKYCEENGNHVICNENDVLIAWDGANAGTVGYGLKGSVGSTLAKLTFDNNRINPTYFGRFLHSRFSYLRDRCTGATIPHISRNVLTSLQIPLPPLPEQKRIAGILDKADALRKLTKEIIGQYDLLAQSVFLEMFGDPVRNQKSFEKGIIRDLVSEVKYGTSSKSEDNGLYPYLRMNNITYSGHMFLENLKYINLTESDKNKYLVKRGDILFNRTNSKELVGKTAVFNHDTEMAIAGYLIRVRVNDMANPYYIWAYLNSFHGKLVLRNMCKNIVGMANINAQELQNIKILLPPITLQNQFASIIENIEKQKELARQSLKESEDLFNGLSQRAFKGELGQFELIIKLSNSTYNYEFTFEGHNE